MTVFQQLENDLREKIIRGEIDTQYPISGEVDLSKQYNISRNSVRKALSNLTSEGLLIKIQGRGTFAVSPQLCIAGSTKKFLKILAVFPDFYMSSSEYVEELMEGILDRTGRVGHKLEYSDQEIDLRQLEKESRNGELDGIIWDRPDDGDRELLSSIDSMGIPLVTINRDHGFGYRLICDAYAEFDQPISFLRRFGHRRIGFLNRDIDNFFFRERHQAFFRAAENHNLIDAEKLYAQAELDTILKTMDSMMKADPSALIIGGHYLLGGVLNYLRKNRIDLPGGLSLICLNDGFMAKNYTTPVTVFTEPRREIGICAVQLLEQLTDGRPPQSKVIKLQGELLMRQSCGLSPFCKITDLAQV